MFKEKIAAGVYKQSDASYRSRWFCVPKKNGSLRLVHDLQPLNAVTIRNAAVPPLVDQFVEGIAAHSCYSMLDLLVGYDHRTLDIASRDLTSFQSPLGALRNTTLPQGSTNAVAIFHGDVTFILKPEIPNVAKPFLTVGIVQCKLDSYVNFIRKVFQKCLKCWCIKYCKLIHNVIYNEERLCPQDTL